MAEKLCALKKKGGKGGYTDINIINGSALGSGSYTRNVKKDDIVVFAWNPSNPGAASSVSITTSSILTQIVNNGNWGGYLKIYRVNSDGTLKFTITGYAVQYTLRFT